MRLSFSFFGPFAVFLDGQEIDVRSRRSRAMLAMLALSPRSSVARDRLAATLWPDRSEEQAKASLRQELSSLRRHLGHGAEFIVADTQCVTIAHDMLNPDHGSSSEGDFLEGLDIRSEPFDDWRREQAASLNGHQKDELMILEEFERNPSVLLMGFIAASHEEEDVTFSTGLVADLRNLLAHWRRFPVVGPEAVAWQTEKDCNMRELASSVGANYAISGVIRRSQNRIRVSVSLTASESGHLIWTDTFDGELTDVFEIQESISRGIVARVTPEVERAEVAKIARVRPTNWTAWQLVARTEELERTGGEGYGTPESNADQIPLLEEAIRLDPSYARAWTRLGRYYFRAAMQGWVLDRKSSMEKALKYTERAISEDVFDWEGHAYRALSLIFGLHQFEPARFHAKEAVRLNPSAPLARHAIGCALEWLGEPETALRHLRMVTVLNPNHANRAAVLGDITTCELLSGNLETAVETARQLLAIAPNYLRGLQRVAVTFGHANLKEEARDVLSTIQAQQADFDEAYVRETYPYARPEHIETILEGLRRAGWDG